MCLDQLRGFMAFPKALEKGIFYGMKKFESYKIKWVLYFQCLHLKQVGIAWKKRIQSSGQEFLRASRENLDLGQLGRRQKLFECIRKQVEDIVNCLLFLK